MTDMNLRSGATAGPANPVPGSSTTNPGTESTASTSGAAGGAANSVTVPVAHTGIATLPTFWTTRPELWFLQAEAVFEDRIPPITTDKAKCNLVLRALTCEALEQVEHVLTGPEPVGGRYPALQTALIDCYGRSQATKYADLIDLTRPGSLGDRKPVQFLLHMRSLAGNDPEACERAIFLNAMPAEVRTVLANSTAPNNKRLSVEAGHVLEQHLLSQRSRGGA